MLNALKKYIRIYLMLIKYSVQADMAYWSNFIISLLVEVFYQIAFLAFFAVIMLQAKVISGWGPYKIMILLGIDTFTSEFLTGAVNWTEFY